LEFGSDPTNPMSLATNRPPVLGVLVDRSIPAGTLLEFSVEATDADLPAQVLTFSLDPPVPPGAEIDQVSGLFRWKPTQTQAVDSYVINVAVTVNGKP